MYTLLYGSKVEKNIDKTDSKENIFTKNRTLSKSQNRRSIAQNLLNVGHLP
jgi:hypothetical protein